MADLHSQESTSTGLDHLTATLSLALPSLTPESSPPSLPSPSNEKFDSYTSPHIPPSLGTLPHDIVHEIVDQGGPDFVFPLANRHLLPFHLSTLYRIVRLGTPNLGHFQRTLKDHTAKYARLVRVLHFHATGSTSGLLPRASPVKLFHRDLHKLVKLEKVHLTGDYDVLGQLLPKPNWYESSPRLRRFLVQSDCAPSMAIFDMSELAIINGVPLDTIGSMHSSGILLDIQKSSTSTLDISYCGTPNDYPYFLNLISPLSITSLRFCSLSSYQGTIGQLFAHLDSSRLIELWVFSLAANPRILAEELQSEDSFNCPVLKHLAIGGSLMLPWNRGFQDAPLESLHFGPRTTVFADSLIDLLYSKYRHGTPLKTLKLDNIFAAVPLTSNPTASEWAVPMWRLGFSDEDADDVRDIAKGLGIEISGTTFLGLEILDSDEYWEAVEREEEEESPETDEE